MNWLLSRDPNPNVYAAIRAAYRQYLINGGEEALEWLERIPEAQRTTRSMQGPVGMYVNEWAWRDADRALAWTEYLTDDGERNVAIITIARRFLVRDPEAAEAWISSVGLTEEQIAKARSVNPNSPAGRVQAAQGKQG